MIISNYHVAENPLTHFLLHTEKKGSKGSRDVRLGQRVGFTNSQYYALKHLVNEGATYNTICVDTTPGAQKFVALGTPTEGLTEEGMLHFIQL